MTTKTSPEASKKAASEKPNRMARRRLKTHQQLLDAAIALVLEKGFDETNTDDITDAADVGRRTFYNHFSNKRDCVMAAVKERYSNYATKAITATEHYRDPALALAHAATQVFNHVAADPITRQLAAYPRLLAEAIEESQREFLTGQLLEGLSQERFAPAVSADVLPPILLWGFVGLVIDSISLEKESEQGTSWAKFVLYNLGLSPKEIDKLQQKLAANLSHQGL